MHDGMGWSGWLMMSSVLFVCMAVVGVLIYLLARASAATAGTGPGDGSTHRPRSAAQLTLDERFARGEIDVPEYEQRKKAILGG